MALTLKLQEIKCRIWKQRLLGLTVALIFGPWQDAVARTTSLNSITRAGLEVSTRMGRPSSGTGAPTSSKRNQIYQEQLFAGLSNADTHRKKIKVHSPFALLRATAKMFFDDLFTQDDLKPLMNQLSQDHAGVRFDAVISGDNHLENFSWVRVFPRVKSPGDTISLRRKFELARNDFDEAVVGPWILDIVRLMASLKVFAEQSGFLKTTVDAALNTSAQNFVKTIAKLAIIKSEGQEAAEEKMTRDLSASLRFLRNYLDEIKSYDDFTAVNKWATRDGVGRFTFRDDRTLPDEKQKLVRLTSDENLLNRKLRQAILAYALRQRELGDFSMGYFEVLDLARRLNAGNGSLGTPRYYALIRADGELPVILDIKGVPAPSFFSHLTPLERRYYFATYGVNHARRAQAGHLAMSRDSSALAGWLELFLATDLPRYFSVNEVSPYKSDFPKDRMVPKNQPTKRVSRRHAERRLMEVARALSVVTVIGQNRAYRELILGRRGVDLNVGFSQRAMATIAGYRGPTSDGSAAFKSALLKLANDYGELLNKDYQSLVAAKILLPANREGSEAKLF